MVAGTLVIGLLVFVVTFFIAHSGFAFGIPASLIVAVVAGNLVVTTLVLRALHRIREDKNSAPKA